MSDSKLQPSVPAPPHQLVTPVYLKLDDSMAWPGDKAFYVLSREGLFLCRNHPFFSSCVPADRWPGELATQRSFLKLNYPRLPQPLFERVVGFFGAVAQRQSSEAAVLLAWNQSAQALEIVVPEQLGTIGASYSGARYAVDLYYEIPPLPPHLLLIGDIHSHADGPAYASWTDKADEAYRPGLHLVVGRLQDEPPEFYCAVTIDGVRSRVHDLTLVIEDYQQRAPAHQVPPDWLARVRVEEWSSSKWRTPPLSQRDSSARLCSTGAALKEPVILSSPPP